MFADFVVGMYLLLLLLLYGCEEVAYDVPYEGNFGK